MSFLNKFSWLRISNFKFVLSNSCNSSGNSSSLLNSLNFSPTRSWPRHLHDSLPRNAAHFKHRDRKDLLRTVGKVDEGTVGEHTVSLDAIVQTKQDMFTDARTPDLLFNNVAFRDLPIAHICVHKNNTKVQITDSRGKPIAYSSAGCQGFQDCRKGTNVAGQTTALFVSKKAIKAGVSDVRLTVRGLGPGRMAAIKGLQMGGLNIISVTDTTRISFKPSHRPRKRKRL